MAIVSSDSWRRLHRGFSVLLEEEKEAFRRCPSDVWLRAYWENTSSNDRKALRKFYPPGVEFRTHEVYGGKMGAEFQARFVTVANEAGIALGVPQSVDPLEHWLRSLFQSLCEHGIREFVHGGADKERGGIIERVCGASAWYCKHLQAEARRQEHKRVKKRVDLSEYMDGARLTERQRSCYSLKYEFGLSNPAIASQLRIDRKTVAEHLDAAERKIGRSRTARRVARPE